MPVERPSLASPSSDNFTIVQHDKQDQEITLASSKYFTREHPGILRVPSTVHHQEDKLKVAYADWFKLMEGNLKLESALKEAWRTIDYKEIRKSGELRASSLAGS